MRLQQSGVLLRLLSMCLGPLHVWQGIARGWRWQWMRCGSRNASSMFRSLHGACTWIDCVCVTVHARGSACCASGFCQCVMAVQVALQPAECDTCESTCASFNTAIRPCALCLAQQHACASRHSALDSALPDACRSCRPGLSRQPQTQGGASSSSSSWLQTSMRALLLRMSPGGCRPGSNRRHGWPFSGLTPPTDATYKD